jgi:hypothetical protein
MQFSNIFAIVAFFLAASVQAMPTEGNMLEERACDQTQCQTYV